MAKSDVVTENDSSEDKLKRIEALADKLSKTDGAFGARFQELMKFSTSISTTEQELKTHANLNKEEFEKIDKRLKLCEKTISGLSTKTQTLEKAIGEHKDTVNAYIGRIDSPLEIISREYLQLSHKFNLLQSALERENKLQKVIIWSYRGALAVIAIFFLYYHFCITRDINSINNTLSNLSEKAMENKLQTNPTNTPISNKPNPSKQ